MYAPHRKCYSPTQNFKKLKGNLQEYWDGIPVLPGLDLGPRTQDLGLLHRGENKKQETKTENGDIKNWRIDWDFDSINDMKNAGKYFTVQRSNQDR